MTVARDVLALGTSRRRPRAHRLAAVPGCAVGSVLSAGPPRPRGARRRSRGPRPRRRRPSPPPPRPRARRRASRRAPARPAPRRSRKAVTADELTAHFAAFCALRGDGAPAGGEPTVSAADFQAALGFSAAAPSVLLARVFKQMAGPAPGATLAFDQYLKGVAGLSPTPSEAKYRFTFALFDAEHAGKLGPAEVRATLAAVTGEAGLALSPRALDELVANAFTEYDVDGDGKLSYAEYRDMCIARPGMLKPLTLNPIEVVKRR